MSIYSLTVQSGVDVVWTIVSTRHFSFSGWDFNDSDVCHIWEGLTDDNICPGKFI